MDAQAASRLQGVYDVTLTHLRSADLDACAFLCFYEGAREYPCAARRATRSELGHKTTGFSRGIEV
jgi:hypothetical protein